MFISSACALGPPRGFEEQGSKGNISKRKMNMFEGTQEQLYMLKLMVGKGGQQMCSTGNK